MFPLIFALILNPSASTLACPLPSHHSLQSHNCSTHCDRTTGTCLHNVSLNAFVIICTFQIYSLLSTSCYMSSNLLTWKRLCHLKLLRAPQIQCFRHFHVLSHRIANLSLKDIFTNKSPKAQKQQFRRLKYCVWFPIGFQVEAWFKFKTPTEIDPLDVDAAVGRAALRAWSGILLWHWSTNHPQR